LQRDLSIYSHQYDFVRRTATEQGKEELFIELAGKSRTTMNNRPRTSEKFEIDVVKFRRRDATAFREHRAPDVSTNNICELLDLSRYELADRSRNEFDSQKDGPDDFKHRMCANIAALILLVALAGLAATDVVKLEAQISCLAETALCGLI
jgi:hypothetical protein